MKISWRQWKLGATVSILLSLFVALAGLTAGMTWKGFLAVFGAAAVTHFGAFLTTHPTDQVSFNSETITKAQNTQTETNK